MDKATNGRFVLATDHEAVERERDALLSVKDAALMLALQHGDGCHCPLCNALVAWEKTNEQTTQNSVSENL